MAFEALPVAFSVPSQVETVGALAGLAAILGLAVLSALYFAQARELKRLRDWAGRAPERAAELQDRVGVPVPRRVTPPPQAARLAAQPVRSPAGQPPQSPQAPRPPGAPVPAAAAVPAAPGVGRPATAAAGAAAAGAGATAPAPAAKPANGQTGTPGAPATPDAPKPATPDPPPAAGEQPTTASPAATPAGADRPNALDDTTISPPPTGPSEGDAENRPAVPQPLPLPPRARTPQTPPSPAPQTPARPPAPRPRTQPLRSATPSATVPPRGGGRSTPPAGSGGGNRRLRIGLLAGAVVIVLAAIVFAITQVTGGGDSSDQPAAKAAQTNTIGAAVSERDSTQTTATTSRPKGQTTVAVLNGTTVPGLARAVADKLESAGYRIGTVTNAPDQSRAATQVYYQRGQTRTAREVARAIDVGSDAVVPMDEVTEATAGSDAVVVVTVGADQSP